MEDKMGVFMGYKVSSFKLLFKVVLLFVSTINVATAAYFKVDPEVTEWKNRFCVGWADPELDSRLCLAKGGTPAPNNQCDGADEAAWEALPVTEKVARYAVEKFLLCSSPDVSFTGYGTPSHSTLCWQPAVKYKYGKENWSTGTLETSGQAGAACDIPHTGRFSALRTRDVTCPEGSVVRDEGDGQLCYKFCPAGQILVNGVCDLPPEKDPCEDNYTRNPCNVATGNKYRSETDLSNNALGFTRHYNSQFLYTTDYGVGWRTNFQKEIIKTADDSLVIVSPAGRGEQWKKINGVWQGDADTKVSLVETTTGYRVTLANTAFDDYNAAGQLVSQTDTNGHQRTLSYNASGQLETVTNQYGHEITLGYTDGRLSSVTDALGEVTEYRYDADRNLEKVIYPDETPATNADNPIKTYHYENSTYPHHLTGITDENGDRYGVFAYGADGKVTSSELAQTTNLVGQQKVSLAYQPDPDPNDAFNSTLLTDAADTGELWSFENILGRRRLLSKINQSDFKGPVQTWDANGNKLTHTDAEGRVTKYTYNATNQRDTMTEAYGTALARVTTYEYVSPDIDLVDKVISPSVFGSNSKETVTAYDANQNVTSVTVNGYNLQGAAVSRTTGFKHDAYGKVTEIDGPRTDVNDITIIDYYDCNTGAECGRIEKVTNAAGHETLYQSYDAAGRLLQMTDANGVVTVNTYHPRGWLATVTQTPPEGEARLTTYNYDSAGQLKKVILPDDSELNYVYDAAHDLREVYDNLNNKVEYIYDARGNRKDELVTDPDGTLVRSIERTYDERNFIERISTDGSITQLVNDAVGNLDLQTNPKPDQVTDHDYDALDRLTSVIDALSNPTDFQYNIADQLSKVTAPNGAVTDYEYDDLGNLTKEISPDRGTLTYQHDDTGNVVRMTDDRGVITEYQYDELNRITQVIYPQAAENISYVYDQGEACGAAIGRLCTVTDATGSHDYQYDVWGNVINHTWQNASTALVMGYGYDSVNRLTRVRYPSGFVITYSRDEIGRVSAVHAPSDYRTEIIADQFTYSADGLIRGFRLGNSQISERVYDLQGRLDNQSIDGTQLTDYEYDPNGNVIEKTDIDQRRNYDYDRLDRLEFDDWVSGLPSNDWEFEYDANGNREEQSRDGLIKNFSYTPNSNQLNTIESNNVVFDPIGNITTLPRDTGNLTLTYNQQNHLATVTNNGKLSSYGYNHQRQRLVKQASGQTSYYLYDLAGRLVATVDSQGTVHEEYVYANEGDYTPIYHRLYDDTEANTVEAQQALENSEQSIADPVNSSGQCEAYERTQADRLDSDALFFDNDNTGIIVGDDVFQIPGVQQDIGWFVPILLWLLDDEQIAQTEVDFDLELDDLVIEEPEIIVSWTPPPATLEHVVDVATTKRSLNNGPDVARHCINSGQNEVQLNHIPLNGTKVYIRVWSKVNGEWQFEDYELETQNQSSAKQQVTRSYIITDHLNTPRFAYDDKQALTWRWASDGFGNQEPIDDPDADGYQVNLNLRFPGQYDDWESGLFFNWNRYYDSEMGRYVTSDPIGLDGGLNTYVYVGATPTKYYDSTGLFKVDKSCKGDCLREKITEEVDRACKNLVASITNPKIKKCVEKRCKKATIRCDGKRCRPRNVPPRHLGYNSANLFGGPTNKIYFCIDNINNSSTFGPLAIHEWGHSCGWGYGAGGDDHPTGFGLPGEGDGLISDPQVN